MAQADFLQRSESLFGSEAISKLEAASVCICGLGGVGSFAAEAIARSGIGRIRLIDYDNIALSNINRQLPALHSNIGAKKTDVIAARIRDINPLCEITVIDQKLTAENAAELIGDADFCIDAIDDVPAKVAVIKHCFEKGIGIVSSMGTGNKLAPEMLQIADISKTFTCPLAKAVRIALRKQGIEKGVKVVFSPELPQKPQESEGEKAVGSCSFVPSAAGLMLASCAIRTIAGIEF